MRVSLRAAFCVVGLAVGYSAVTHAQMDETSYVITYIEVTPSATTDAMDLLLSHAETSRHDNGNSLYQILQRIGRPNHFAILQTWGNADAQAAHTAAEHTSGFRSSLDPLLYSPYDERVHTNLHVAGGTMAAGSIFGLTHVDIIPTGLDVGLARIGELVAASRGDVGVIRFDVLTQASRRNHMTLVESWESAGSQEAHSAANHKKSFRAALQPLSGSLYDERLYRAL
jgi:quinol monooxygenase YgiN